MLTLHCISLYWFLVVDVSIDAGSSNIDCGSSNSNSSSNDSSNNDSIIPAMIMSDIADRMLPSIRSYGSSYSAQYSLFNELIQYFNCINDIDIIITIIIVILLLLPLLL